MSKRQIKKEIQRKIKEALQTKESENKRINWGAKEKNLAKTKTIRDYAEEAIKAQQNVAAYTEMRAIKSISDEKARKLVMDSYTNYFENAGLYSFNAISHSKFMGYAFLSYLSQDAMINNGITIMADELTRKWGKCTSTNERSEADLKKIDEKLEELNAKHRFRESAIYTGFFGGCLMYMDLRKADGSQPDDAELELPLYIDGKDELNKAKLKGMKLVGLKPIEPINISPAEFNSSDPKQDNFYKPTHFYVLGKKIHRSRFLYFADLIPPMVLKPVYMFFGIPLAQLAFDYVQDFYSNKEAVSKIVKKFSLLTFKTDTQKLLQNGETGVQERIATMAKYRDNDSVFIVDINEEDVAQINTPLTGLKEIWYANLELLPVIFKMPVTKLLQTSPSGFNATGEYDMRSYYDSVNTKQSVLFGEQIERLIDIICLTLGIESKGIYFKWTSLFELSDKEQAEVNKVKADTDSVLNQIGAVSNVEVAKRLNADENSGYNGLEIPEEISPTREDEEDIEEIIDSDEVLNEETVEDKFPNEHSGRVRSPEDFEKGSFRRKNIANGVDIILGKLKSTGKWATQTYRLKSSVFTKEQAENWLKEHKAGNYSFSKATGEK